ncbi:unnamed protein product, partial [Laminaria digitata]
MIVAREDTAAQLAREGQTSFEAFSEFGWRSISEPEGIAAFALVECGKQGSASRSSSRGDPAPNGRVDSRAWGDLLNSGGETPCPPGGIGRFKSASCGDDEGQGGTTTNSNNNSGKSSSNNNNDAAGGSSSNSGGGGGGGAMSEESASKPLELGPMPVRP